MNTNPKIVVLLVEDDISRLDYYANTITRNSPRAEILKASTLEEAKQHFAHHFRGVKPISIIVMDGCMNKKSEPDTLPLITEIRNTGFTGPMIAASGSESIKERMMAAGCNHSVEHKGLVPMKVLDLLAGM